MKKTYFNPGSLRFVQRLPMMQSRRIFGSDSTGHFRSTAYKTDGKDDDDDEATKKEKEALFNAIDERVQKALATRATVEELAQIKKDQQEALKGISLESLRAMADDKSGAMATLAAQGLEIKRLKDQMNKQPQDMSIRAQCAAYLKTNEAKIKNIREGQQAELPIFELDIRAAADSPMLPSTVMPGGSTYITRFEVQPGLVRDLRNDPTFWDYIRKGSTGSETYIWINKKPTDGAAGFIGPGVYKPAVSFTVEAEVSHAKKVADNQKMATELLEDIDGFTSWVEEELKYMLDMRINEVLQGNGAGSTTVPEGLQHMSVAYNALTGVSTADPTFWDAIVAGVTQLRVSKFKGTILAFVNPVDYANAKLTKAKDQGQLFIPPATGAVIVEDLNMPLGYVQFIAIDYYKILIYKGFKMKWGLENDDLTKNLVTVIGEMRFHQFHSSNHDGFAIYDEIAAIKTAITEAPAP